MAEAAPDTSQLIALLEKALAEADRIELPMTAIRVSDALERLQIELSLQVSKNTPI